MPVQPSMPASQRVVQVCLFIVAAIAVIGGALQMYLGEPRVSQRLDNVHRFMAGVLQASSASGRQEPSASKARWCISLHWGVFLAGIGRLLSISQVGLPEPAAVWLGYLIPELLLPVVIAAAHLATHRNAQRRAAA